MTVEELSKLLDKKEQCWKEYKQASREYLDSKRKGTESFEIYIRYIQAEDAFKAITQEIGNAEN